MRMHMAFALISLGTISSGCGGNHSHSQNPSNLPPSEVSNHPVPTREILLRNWRIELKSKCDKTPLETCPGAYGINFTSEGTYVVGPGPEGQKWEGLLSEEDLIKLKNALKDLRHQEVSTASEARLDGKRKEGCFAPISRHSESAPVISFAIHLENDFQASVNTSETETCFENIPKGKAIALHHTLSDFSTRYSPEKFPNDCVNATNRLEHLFKDVRECKKDEECSYIDEEFLPVSGFNYADVVSDDCSFSKPLIVANHFSATSRQLDLLEHRAEVLDACGSDKKRPTCKAEKKYPIYHRNALCIDGKCKAHSSIRMK